jgi:hypothetical protein
MELSHIVPSTTKRDSSDELSRWPVELSRWGATAVRAERDNSSSAYRQTTCHARSCSVRGRSCCRNPIPRRRSNWTSPPDRRSARLRHLFSRRVHRLVACRLGSRYWIGAIIACASLPTSQRPKSGLGQASRSSSAAMRFSPTRSRFSTATLIAASLPKLYVA